MIVNIFALLVGFALWYLFYGLELYLNGAITPERPFKYLIKDLSFNLPGGWKRRLKYTDGDEELAKMFPGWGHIISTHIFLPLMPLMIVNFLKIALS